MLQLDIQELICLLLQLYAVKLSSATTTRCLPRDAIPSHVSETNLCCPILCLPRLSDLTPMDLSVWGFLKEEVYRTEVASLEDLRSQLYETILRLKDKLSLQTTVDSIWKRARVCIKHGGKQFQQQKL
ncbi:hypothetical protein HNY73_017336 [Argiope bruennichi]|uniref:Uncharacterized protein n=1 Tax=Argiope bruennichi TaxID=94029 RepID=A0A8T0EL80_ARGBR|nr:hypothetical protein HNY73_017336 [Argiope bruennichi]